MDLTLYDDLETTGCVSETENITRYANIPDVIDLLRKLHSEVQNDLIDPVRAHSPFHVSHVLLDSAPSGPPSLRRTSTPSSRRTFCSRGRTVRNCHTGLCTRNRTGSQVNCHLNVQCPLVARSVVRESHTDSPSTCHPPTCAPTHTPMYLRLPRRHYVLEVVTRHPLPMGYPPSGSSGSTSPFCLELQGLSSDTEEVLIY